MSEALVAAPQAGGASSVAPLYKRIPYYVVKGAVVGQPVEANHPEAE
jgi:hypothetical protein